MTVWTNTSRDLKALLKYARKGTVLYTINERPHYPGADHGSYSEHVVKDAGIISGKPMIDATLSVKELLLAHGPVYDAPPPGLPHVNDPHPQPFRPQQSGGSWNDQLAEAGKWSREANERRARGWS